ncbi:MAG: hypothetical protein LBU36_04665 [Clostridiales bacterium]|jgi:hypothetical protein|nr:hypothetical protein [Clostridiales bacterium]
MKKNIKTILAALALAGVLSAAAASACDYFIGRFEADAPPAYYPERARKAPPPAAPAFEAPALLSPGARISYEYAWPDGRLSREETEAPYFLIGKNRSQLAAVYPRWEVREFTPKSVVLRRRVVPEAQGYIIGERDGFIAVFYDDEARNLAELTDISTAALSPEEKERLREGVKAVGEAELGRFLEAYGS